MKITKEQVLKQKQMVIMQKEKIENRIVKLDGLLSEMDKQSLKSTTE